MARLLLPCFRGRVGLAGILKSLNMTSGDEVITQAFTCVAVPEGIIAGGATPIFADLRENSINIDVAQVEKKISSKTKAIVIQHTFGYAGPVDEIVEIARSKQIRVIEDCCHTFRTTVNGVRVGEIGDAAFYSLEWGKPIPCGVGGLVSANDATLLESLSAWHAMLRNPGLARRFRLDLQYLAFSALYRPRTYWAVKRAFNFLSKLGAAEGNFNEVAISEPSDDFGLGISKSVYRRFLTKKRALDKVTDHSRKIVDVYRKIDLSESLSRISEDTVAGSRLARYPLWCSKKQDLLGNARSLNVEIADWYRTPIHPLGGRELATVNYHLGSCPIAELACSKIVSLPTNQGVGPRYLNKVSRLLSAS